MPLSAMALCPHAGLYVVLRRHRLSDGRGSWPAVVLGRELSPIRLVGLRVLHLRVHAGRGWLVPCRSFRRSRMRLDAVRSAAVAGAGIDVCVIIDDHTIVRVIAIARCEPG